MPKYDFHISSKECPRYQISKRFWQNCPVGALFPLSWLSQRFSSLWPKLFSTLESISIVSFWSYREIPWSVFPSLIDDPSWVPVPYSNRHHNKIVIINNNISLLNHWWLFCENEFTMRKLFNIYELIILCYIPYSYHITINNFLASPDKFYYFINW